MGNQHGKGFCGLKTRTRREPMGFIHHQASPSHAGIRTVDVDKVCTLSTGSELRVSIVTWNMNGQVSFEDLAEMVGDNCEFDLLVIGLQEAPRNKVAKLLKAALVQTHILIGKVIMQSLQLYLFGPKNAAGSSIRELKVDKQSVGGCGGIIGRKKGAVAIWVNYEGIRMVFISCHLSAHAGRVEDRNSECRHISHSLFSKNWNPYARPAHVTVWLGDLNYRLQGIDTHPARTLIQKDLHGLLGKDQLLQEAGRGQIFNGYCEGTLTFRPTYKYNVGSSTYDTSYKVRVPAWTDRILFKVEDTDNMEAILRSYESMDEINGSDHKPVKALLCLRLRQTSPPLVP
ncbi:type IV inositol polyphosphate 5-phosphatase 11 isoform X2 [Prosopis cineraria]|uniref:type IV inositol polyphosphate 5-phosphatase 11 isoform X2 n=1 Tax=Prosopis cineraria TaxID=364024 RepID=UPI00240FD7C0|nr:type IV inositol polyphosphate 5-phosphatase 11 isoform X2 [Prosopis cineraria]